MQRSWKRRWRRAEKMIAPPLMASCMVLSAYSTALASPSGGEVVSGSAVISSGAGATTITQVSDKTIITWRSFSIASGEKVSFIQPSVSSVALNRVTGNDSSAIYGTLSANGQVFLVNPNGILFAKGSAVNVGGLVASTLDISDSSFNRGSYSFSSDSLGTVVNNGAITVASGGYVALLGAKVANNGVVAAKQGKVALMGGSAVTLDFAGDGLLNAAIDKAAFAASVSNSGVITASDGKVYMSARTADALAGTVVNNSGVIEAENITSQNGMIILDGGSSGRVVNSGTLDASGKGNGQQGGTVKVLGEKAVLAAGSSIDVSGDVGGGTALVGGNYQGGGSEQHARAATIERGASINADAITKGNGGTAVVWSDENTNFAGKISAHGGSISGNGGTVETSSKGTLKVSDSASVNTTASKGSLGTWLLDPADITIGSGGDVSTSTLSAALASNNVTITTNSSGSGISGSGDITVASDLTWSGTGVLTLSAYRNVNVNANISISDTGTLSHAGLDLQYGTGGTYSLKNGKSITFNGTAPTLTIQSQPYTIINNTSALQNVGSSGYYALGTNLAFDSSSPALANAVIPSFNGTFDGLGHTISNVKIIAAEKLYVGLFGMLNTGGVIKNLGLENISVSSSSSSGYIYSAGGLVGYNYGEITGSYAKGTVSGTGNYYVGGLVGYNQGKVSGSYVAGMVSSTGTDYAIAGGLAGYSYGEISGSYATGAVSGTANYRVNVGGLVGLNYSPGKISDSYATGTVSGTNPSDTSFAGGLVGSNGGTITNSYATGAVSIAGYKAYIGALAGYNNSGSITDCYATGTVSSTASISHNAGLVGDNAYSTVSSSYWDTSKEILSGHIASSAAGDTITAYLSGTIIGTGGIGASGFYYIPVSKLTASTATLTDTSLVLLSVSNASSSVVSSSGYYVGSTGTSLLSSVNTITNLDLTLNTLTVGSLDTLVPITNSMLGLAYGSDSSKTVYSVSGNDLMLTNGFDFATTSGTIYSPGGNVTTVGGSQIYNGAVKLTTATALTGNTIDFQNTVDGAADLTITGNAVFDGNVGSTAKLTSLHVSGISTVGGNVSTIGSQTYAGAVTLSGTSSTLTGSTIDFQNTVDGAADLTITGNAGFDENVGSTAKLTSLHVSGTSTVGGNVSTIGSQTYAGAVTLSRTSSILTGSTIDFQNTVDGAADLTITGNAGFDGNVGSTAKLTSLHVSGTSTVGGNVSTNGSQNYTGAVTLSAGSALQSTNSGGDITFNGRASSSGGISVNAALAGININSALTAGNNVVLTAQNDITIGAAGSVASIGGNVTLVSSGGHFVNNSASSNVLSGKRWLVYSTGLSGDTRGALNYDFSQYGTSYGGGITGTGNGFIYSRSLNLAAAFTGTFSKEYDGDTSAVLSSSNFVLNGLTGAHATFTTSGVSANYNSKNVADAKTVTVTGTAALTSGVTDSSNKPVFGYNFNTTINSQVSGEITAKSITAALTGTVNKTYDGTTTATLKGSNYTLSGVLAQDQVSVATTSGNYDTKNIGTDKKVSVSDLTLSGADASNYSLAATSITGVVGEISQGRVTDAAYSAAVISADKLTIADGKGIKNSGVFRDLSLTIIGEGVNQEVPSMIDPSKAEEPK